MRREPVDHGATGISQAENLRDFIEGLAGGVVTGVADVLVGPTHFLLGEIQMSVSAGNH